MTNRTATRMLPRVILHDRLRDRPLPITGPSGVMYCEPPPMTGENSVTLRVIFHGYETQFQVYLCYNRHLLLRLKAGPSGPNPQHHHHSPAGGSDTPPQIKQSSSYWFLTLTLYLQKAQDTEENSDTAKTRPWINAGLARGVCTSNQFLSLAYDPHRIGGPNPTIQGLECLEF